MSDVTMDSAKGIVLFAGDWVGLLTAGTENAEHALLVGKVDPPHVDESTQVVLIYRGLVRCRMPALGLHNGVRGWSVVVSGQAIAGATPVTMDPGLLRDRWNAVTGCARRGQPWFLGWREPWWLASDERPFPRWATEGLEPAEAERANELTLHFRGVVAPTPPAPAVRKSSFTPEPASAPAKPKAGKVTAKKMVPSAPPTGQRGLF